MPQGNHVSLRVLAVAAALLLGCMELLALQKARLTRWRLTHQES